MDFKEDKKETEIIDEKTVVGKEVKKPKTRNTSKVKEKKDKVTVEPNEVVETEKVDESMSSILDLYPSHNEIWVDEKGGVWTSPMPKAKHYKRK